MAEISGLYLVTDRALCGERGVVTVVREAVRGGVKMVQLREKELSTRAFIEEAQAIKALLSPFSIPLIINDRVDVALAAAAQGVHLGQEDMPPAMARKLMGKSAIIGLSVETWVDVKEAAAADVDYLGVSPIFPTPTKRDTKGAWGLEGLRQIRKMTSRPLVAIGGIHEGNIASVVGAGADAVAVVSAICAASDPYLATRRLCDLLYEATAH